MRTRSGRSLAAPTSVGNPNNSRSKRRRDGSPQAAPKSSSSSLSGENKSKLYVVYYEFESREQIYYVHEFDISNVNDDGDKVKSPSKPVLTLHVPKYPSGMGVASLGSKIYFVGGCYCGANHVLSTDLYVYDTKEKLTVKKGQPMKAGKLLPIVLTINGRIYVISRKPHTETTPRAEVFNPNDDSWATLPDPPFCFDVDCPYGVEAYTVKNSTIFLSSRDEGIYFLDVAEPSVWRQLRVAGGVRPFPFRSVAQSVDEICYACHQEGKHIIQPYDFITSNGGAFLQEIKVLHPVEPKFKRLEFFVECDVVSLGDGKLGLIRSGFDDIPFLGEPVVEGRLYITLDVFQVVLSIYSHAVSFFRLYSSTYVIADHQAIRGFPFGAFFLM
ncbi:DUF1668 domain-containing protein [Cephalotus follicularis]|uniref:DUF1668 domain-containing protein n=1 Tax=Cephalotus follicularis TaxID=3775 RepID=A0A1Q3D3R9_CEPFO|nr:DUF1668 domain-containing protein [Cephalotus follicularis]